MKTRPSRLTTPTVGAVGGAEDPPALARRARRQVGGAHQSRLLGHVRRALLAVPEVVAAGEDVHAGGGQRLARVAVEAEAAGGVLDVGDDQVRVVALPQRGQQRPDGVASGRADDVGDEEDVQALLA